MIGHPKHYRIWCDFHNDWETHKCYVNPQGIVIHDDRVSNKDHTVEYYMSYRDKNGVQICEGDIVLTDEAGWIAQVVFDGDSFCCLKKNSGFSSMCNWSEFEVLGNIHQHPEKLEGEVVYFGKARLERLNELNLEKDFSRPKTLADEIHEGPIAYLAERKGYARLWSKCIGGCNWTITVEDEARTKSKSFTNCEYDLAEASMRDFLKELPFVKWKVNISERKE